MAPETFAEPDDDPAFLACVDRMIAGLVERHSPEEIYLVRIVNWFDHKWLRFSGIGRVPLHGRVAHTALDEFRQEQVTFPPFTPNRVATQHDFCRTTRGDFEEQAPAHLVHRARFGHSSRNLQRRVADFGRSAVFVWFSSHSRSNGQGSVMAYIVGPDGFGAWYAGLQHASGWRLGLVKGASRVEVESFFIGSHRATEA